MQLSMIAAVDINGLIGIDNRLPVRLPADLRRFRIMTSGKPVIMGRKTHESIGKCLDNRTNIVLTRNTEYEGCKGAIIVHNLVEAYMAAYKTGASHSFVIGGAEIFRQFLPICNRFYMTLIEDAFIGDTYFPVPMEDIAQWEGKVVQTFEKSNANPHKHTFHILDIPEVQDLSAYYE